MIHISLIDSCLDHAKQSRYSIAVKVKVNVDLYSALSWSHREGAQVWHAFSRDLTVLRFTCTPRAHPL